VPAGVCVCCCHCCSRHTCLVRETASRSHTHTHTHTCTRTHHPSSEKPSSYTAEKLGASPARVVRCHRPGGRKHLRKSRVFRPRRQYALERPAPPPAHGADTSDTGRTHFALVRHKPLSFFNTGRPKERVYTYMRWLVCTSLTSLIRHTLTHPLPHSPASHTHRKRWRRASWARWV